MKEISLLSITILHCRFAFTAVDDDGWREILQMCKKIVINVFVSISVWDIVFSLVENIKQFLC